MPKRSDRNLTAAFCRTAKPAEVLTPDGPKAARIAYPDNEVRGLELRVSATGERAWSFRYRDRLTDRQGRVTLGLFDPMVDDDAEVEGEARRLTLRGARIAARLLRAKVDGGDNPAAERRVARSTAKAQPLKTMSDLATAYFAACETGAHRSGRGRRKAASTLGAERWLWTKHAEPRLGGDLLEEVTRARVRQVLRDTFEASGGQANRVRALLSQMFNFAIAEERLAMNPVTHVARLSEVAARTRTLCDDEMKRLWQALQNSEGLVIANRKAGDKVLISRIVRIAIELAMVTLQRRGEIAGMRRSELDLARRTWLIPAERTKGRAEHLVPLSDHAVALIEDALERQETRRTGVSDFVFPSPQSNDDAIEPAAMSHAMADLTCALGFSDVVLHDLRRTGATGIAALGVPPYIVSKVLAHKDGGGGAAITARHYNLYAYAAEKRDALARWAAHLSGVFGALRAAGGTGESPGCHGQTPPAGERLWTELVEATETTSGSPGNAASSLSAERLWTDLVEA